jgi:hypothetical protein
MPTRYLKPGIRDSETIDDLPPMAEILYYRLLVTVDDYGRYDGRPQMVKSACFPIKDEITAKKAEALLVDLAKAGLVLLYEVAGKPYIQMLKWDNKPRAVVSNYPAPTDGCMQVYADVCNTNTDAPLTVTETKTETDMVLFDKFWRAYPKKVAKDSAQKAFQKRKVDHELLETMLNALAKQKISEAWTKDNGQFVPNPATWLNGGRWMDEVDPTTAYKPSSIFAGAI